MIWEELLETGVKICGRVDYWEAVTWAVARSIDYWEQTHENQMKTRQRKIGRERCDKVIHIFLLAKFLRCAQAILFSPGYEPKRRFRAFCRRGASTLDQSYRSRMERR